jgi:hypothetical protein
MAVRKAELEEKAFPNSSLSSDKTIVYLVACKRRLP